MSAAKEEGGVRIVFVLGGPGAGKGTQCERLVREFGFVHLSAGDLLRAERQSGSSHGALIDEHIKQGTIVPVEITVELIKAAIERSSTTRFLVDGFPRNRNNLDGWERVMGTANVRIEFVLYLACGQQVMQQRLLARASTSGRNDDNLESIQKRFVTYENETRPIIEHFRALGKLREVDSTRDVDTVFNELVQLFRDE